MERESNPMQAMCRSGCGFYGNPATEGLCSKCFKETLKKKQQPPTSSVSTTGSLAYQGAGNSPSSPYVPSAVNTPSPYPVMVQTSAPMRIPIVTAAEFLKEVRKEEGEAKRIQTERRESQEGWIEIKDNAVEAIDFGGATASGSTGNSVSSGDTDDQCLDGKSPDKSSPVKIKKNRCISCRKKVGLTGFECRCGGLFCSIHRYSDKHSCTFDYREMGAQEIRRNNPVVVGEKIQKI